MRWPFENDTSAIVRALSKRMLASDRKSAALLVVTIALAVAERLRAGDGAEFGRFGGKSEGPLPLTGAGDGGRPDRVAAERHAEC